MSFEMGSKILTAKDSVARYSRGGKRERCQTKGRQADPPTLASPPPELWETRLNGIYSGSPLAFTYLAI